MSQRAFNNCVIGYIDVSNPGTTVATGDMITGSGRLDSIGYDIKTVTLNHCIHNTRLDLIESATFTMPYDQSALTTQDRDDGGSPAVTDDDKCFGGTHKFYYDNTLIEEFDGVVTVEYNDDSRISTVTITGEGHGS